MIARMLLKAEWRENKVSGSIDGVGGRRPNWY